jgi:DNA-binding PadR family transcriptional regulator
MEALHCLGIMGSAVTELDFTVLAIIGRDGPMSAYDVRKVFATSLTPTWSASTGSIYPSIRRLEAHGYAQASTPEGARSRKTLSITAPGRAALYPWLTQITPEMAASTPDAIRTRLFFLMFADPSQRLEIVECAMRSTETALSDADRRRAARPPRVDDQLLDLAREGVRFELKARLEWLRWVKRELTRAREGPGA